MTSQGLSAETLGAASSLVCALAWTLLVLVARALGPYLNALSVNMLRSVTGAVFLILTALVTGGFGTLRAVSLGSWVSLTLSILLSTAIGDTAFFESTKTLGMARAMTVGMLYPVIASGLALWLFGERITPAIAAGSLITLAGLVLIVGERAGAAGEVASGRARGLGLALLGAVTWAVSVVLLKAPLGEVDPVTVQAVRLSVAALALGATPWVRGTIRSVRAHLRAIAPLLAALGALTAISSVTFVVGLKYAGVALASVLSSTAPLFALPVGLVAFGERVTWRAVAGALLAIAGIALLSV